MKNSAKNLLLAVTGGAIIGSALGILLAPSEGSKTRRRLIGSPNAIEDQIDKAIRAGKKSWKNMKKDASDATDDAEYYYDHLVREGKKALKEAKYRAENGLEDIEDSADGYLSKVVTEGKRLWNSISTKAEDKVEEVKEKVEDTTDMASKKVKTFSNDFQRAI